MNALTKLATKSHRKTGILPLVATMIVVALVVDAAATIFLYSTAVQERANGKYEEYPVISISRASIR